MNLPEHTCTHAGERLSGFYSLEPSEMEKLVTSDATADEINDQLRKRCVDDAAKNPPVAVGGPGFVDALRRAMLRNRPFLIYCGLCFDAIAAIHPEPLTDSGKGHGRAQGNGDSTNVTDLLVTLVRGSEEHKRNGIAPDCVALIFVQSERTGEQSELRQHALVCNEYPIKQEEADEYAQRFSGPDWRFAGHVFSYQIAGAGTAFEAHPDSEFGSDKWDQMLDAPVLGTGLTYREKIMRRLTGLDYATYKSLTAKGGGNGRP